MHLSLFKISNNEKPSMKEDDTHFFNKTDTIYLPGDKKNFCLAWNLTECESSRQKAARIFNFYPAIKGWGWKINFVPLNAAWQSVLRILRVHYYGSQVYIHVEFQGPSTAKVVYPWDWHVVINKWLLKLTSCKFEGDKSSQDFCWSKKKRGQPSAQRPLGLSVCLR